MKALLSVFSLALFLSLNAGQAQVSHQKWDELLRTYVGADGKVAYSGFQTEKGKLDQYLKLLADNPVQEGWSRQQEMAYWINAYNAFTVKLIADNYPLKSIRDLHKGNPWDVVWIKLGKQSYSLNQIENEILRPKFKDARIHFAVNCAAKSCPPLLNRAFTAEKLDQQLDEQTRRFLQNKAYNQIQPGAVKVSKIFEWYAQDFGKLPAFLSKYNKTAIKPEAKIEYLEYDWALNE